MRFFVMNNILLSDFALNRNVECLHATRGQLLIMTSKEYVIFSLEERKVIKRGQGLEIAMLKWGAVSNRSAHSTFVVLAKGYNHANPA